MKIKNIIPDQVSGFCQAQASRVSKVFEEGIQKMKEAERTRAANPEIQ